MFLSCHRHSNSKLHRLQFEGEENNLELETKIMNLQLSHVILMPLWIRESIIKILKYARKCKGGVASLDKNDKLLEILNFNYQMTNRLVV